MNLYTKLYVLSHYWTFTLNLKQEIHMNLLSMNLGINLSILNLFTMGLDNKPFNLNLDLNLWYGLLTWTTWYEPCTCTLDIWLDLWPTVWDYEPPLVILVTTCCGVATTKALMRQCYVSQLTISGHFRSFRELWKNTIHKSLFIKTLFIVLLFIIFEVILIFWETFGKFTIH